VVATVVVVMMVVMMMMKRRRMMMMMMMMITTTTSKIQCSRCSYSMALIPIAPGPPPHQHRCMSLWTASGQSMVGTRGLSPARTWRRMSNVS
jgi:hypothetical protein